MGRPKAPHIYLGVTSDEGLGLSHLPCIKAFESAFII